MDSTALVASIIGLVFVALSLWHVRMALSPASGENGAVPSVDGKPLFVPSTRATLAVAAVLLAFAVLVVSTAGLLAIGVPTRLLAWASDALAVGLLARAVGDFRYIGFFKRMRGSPFARLDTRVYSPLCLALGVGVALVAWQHSR